MSLAKDFDRLRAASVKADADYSDGKIPPEEWSRHSDAFTNFIDYNGDVISGALRAYEQAQRERADWLDLDRLLG